MSLQRNFDFLVILEQFVTHHVIYVFARLFHSFAGVANGFHSNQR